MARDFQGPTDPTEYVVLKAQAYRGQGTQLQARRTGRMHGPLQFPANKREPHHLSGLAGNVQFLSFGRIRK